MCEIQLSCEHPCFIFSCFQFFLWVCVFISRCCDFHQIKHILLKSYYFSLFEFYANNYISISGHCTMFWWDMASWTIIIRRTIKDYGFPSLGTLCNIIHYIASACPRSTTEIVYIPLCATVLKANGGDLGLSLMDTHCNLYECIMVLYNLTL